ncbi:myb-like protein D [Oppia nitens]|uniref:myb-like protein D n=1 Tax=Oppia nitens TaxID=1686743 RepID=UPI0023DA9CC6|nr:myb-like protein D [Oppia nitens]
MANCKFLDLVYILLCLLINTIILVRANTFQWANDPNLESTSHWHRDSQQNGAAVCVDIPSNVTLCQGIGYTKMRLPNLLNHDTLREVSEQAKSWIPLSQLDCHPDTKLFLCSLFSPVCLDHPIPPCRSLCQTVQTACERVMLNYGYSWPTIVKCDQFPIDNDMCIQAQHGRQQSVAAAAPPLVSQTSDRSSNHNNNRVVTSSDQHQEVKHHRKPGSSHRNKGNGKHKRRNHNVDIVDDNNSNSQRQSTTGAHKVTVYEPQVGHLQVQPNLDASRVDNNNEMSVNTDRPPIRKWSDSQRQLYNDVITNFCRSQWILKARIYPVNNNKNEIKIRNYRLIHGEMRPNQAPVVLSANSTVIEKLMDNADQSSSSSPVITKQTTDAQRRYFIIGTTDADTNTNWATFVMQWPHKSPQLRKALKAITNNDYDCTKQDNSEHTSAGNNTGAGHQRQHNNNNNNRQSQRQNNERKNHRKDRQRVGSKK